MFENLKVQPVVMPILCKNAAKWPEEPGWRFEPKFDGFRCIAFRDGLEVMLQSRSGKDLGRYFPEVVEAILNQPDQHFVVDGEIIVQNPVSGALDFELLGQRIHPAQSRITKLSAEFPGVYVLFDYLGNSQVDLRAARLAQRVETLATSMERSKSVILSPSSESLDIAQQWFSHWESAGFDGVVAKRNSSLYLENKREYLKMKHKRTAECVVLGYRKHVSGSGIGSLVLGMYFSDGELLPVGVASGMGIKLRDELFEVVSAISRGTTSFAGEGNRWKSRDELEYQEVIPSLVVEVSYDFFQVDRFRSPTKFLRFRPDKTSEMCRFEDVAPKGPQNANELLHSNSH